MDNSPYTVKIDKNISLHIRTLSDAKELFALTKKNEKRLMEWMPWMDKSMTLADTKTFIKKTSKGFDEGTSCDFAIRYDGKIVGSGGFHSIDPVNKVGKIGYWLDAEYEGKGIISAMVKKILELGKKKYRLHRVEISADAKNIRSNAVAQRLGFTHEGTLRESRFRNGKFHDTEVWSLILKK